jgi:copper resistance protein C
VIPRLPAALIAACLLLAVSVGAATAHADLVESDPADGDTIQTPALLTATFNEDLDPDASSIVVRNAAGDEVASGSVDEEDPSLMIVALPDLPTGDYTVRWTAVTPDDQGVTRGTITFTVAPSAPSPSPFPTPTASPTGTLVPPVSPSPTLSPTASPSPSPSPPPIDNEPTGGMTDVLLVLALAGAVVGGLAIYLLRRR